VLARSLEIACHVSTRPRSCNCSTASGTVNYVPLFMTIPNQIKSHEDHFQASTRWISMTYQTFTARGIYFSAVYALCRDDTVGKVHGRQQCCVNGINKETAKSDIPGGSQLTFESDSSSQSTARADARAHGPPLRP